MGDPLVAVEASANRIAAADVRQDGGHISARRNMPSDRAAHNAAIERLHPFIGEWSVEASFPFAPPTAIAGRTVFEGILGGQFLVERSEVAHPDAPDSFAIIGFDPDREAYTQHYFDSRGVARVYAMTFGDGVWILLRDSPDFSPLDFSQRFTGTFSADGSTIDGRWETSSDGSTWEHDFALTYTKVE
jgi:hypothetical protein